MSAQHEHDADAKIPEKEEPRIIKEIDIEELAIDGICGVY